MKKIVVMVAMLFATSAAAEEAATTTETKTEVKTEAKPEATAAAASSSGLTVEAKLCKKLESRNPVDEASSFTEADGQVIAWSKVTGASAGTEIHHVWFMGDQQTDDIKLNIGGSPWRTNSKKTIRPNMKGDWRVEVRDSSGAVLETLKFNIQ